MRRVLVFGIVLCCHHHTKATVSVTRKEAAIVESMRDIDDENDAGNDFSERIHVVKQLRRLYRRQNMSFARWHRILRSDARWNFTLKVS